MIYDITEATVSKNDLIFHYSTANIYELYLSKKKTFLGIGLIKFIKKRYSFTIN